jgi:hypothetical protein
MNTITLTLSIQEANLVLQALGNAPYATVFELIEKIKAQAQGQVQPQEEPKESE